VVCASKLCCLLANLYFMPACQFISMCGMSLTAIKLRVVLGCRLMDAPNDFPISALQSRTLWSGTPV
jgi:hypothetical protein